MISLTIERVRQIIDGAEANRGGDGEQVGLFTDGNAYAFLRCARFLLGYIDQAAKQEVYRTEGEKLANQVRRWRDGG